LHHRPIVGLVFKIKKLLFVPNINNIELNACLVKTLGGSNKQGTIENHAKLGIVAATWDHCSRVVCKRLLTFTRGCREFTQPVHWGTNGHTGNNPAIITLIQHCKHEYLRLLAMLTNNLEFKEWLKHYLTLC